MKGLYNVGMGFGPTAGHLLTGITRTVARVIEFYRTLKGFNMNSHTGGNPW